MNAHLKTTSLNQWHRKAGANMADFGGFDMPLWYETGVKNEHLAVLKSAGIFDTSHMACINVEGKDSLALLNFCFTREIRTLDAGKCTYGAFLDENGHCVDDAIIYKFSQTQFMICVNAGMGKVVTNHLESQKNSWEVPIEAQIEDKSGQVAKMDIQGRKAAKILSKLIKNPELVFNKMVYFSFKGDFDTGNRCLDPVTLLDGTPVLLSRSGYTGEFGFEIFLDPESIVKLWKDVLAVGAEYDILACGLGARDSLRAGAGLPLSHQDIGPFKFTNHPWEFALPYLPGKKTFSKNFLGANALAPEGNDKFTYPFAGNTLRKVNAGQTTQVLDENQKIIGQVLSCATDMGIGLLENKIVSINTPNLPRDLKIKGISCGFVIVEKPLEPGVKLTLKEGKRTIDVTIVSQVRPDKTARMKIDNFI